MKRYSHIQVGFNHIFTIKQRGYLMQLWEICIYMLSLSLYAVCLFITKLSYTASAFKLPVFEYFLSSVKYE